MREDVFVVDRDCLFLTVNDVYEMKVVDRKHEQIKLSQKFNIKYFMYVYTDDKQIKCVRIINICSPTRGWIVV